MSYNLRNPKVVACLGLLSLIALLGGLGLKSYRLARACFVSRVLALEISETQSLQESLRGADSPESLEISFLTEPRESYQNGLTEYIKQLGTSPEPDSSVCGALMNGSQRWLSKQSELRAFTETQKKLTPLWNERLSANQSLAKRMVQDFEHDRKLLCHSRKSLGDSLLMKHILQTQCQPGTKYRCKPHLARLSKNVAELTLVEHTNASKFIGKWGEDRMHEKLCN